MPEREDPKDVLLRMTVRDARRLRDYLHIHMTPAESGLDGRIVDDIRDALDDASRCNALDVLGGH